MGTKKWKGINIIIEQPLWKNVMWIWSLIQRREQKYG